MSNQPPLNPDALAQLIMWKELPFGGNPDNYIRLDANAAHKVIELLKPHLTVAQPEVTGEQVNLAGWTCNGIHEPGDYSTCEECRDACDDLARFYNHMMRNPRPFKHWTSSPEVNDGR